MAESDPKTPEAGQPGRGINNPLDLVVLTRDRIQETLEDAIERGRITRDGANEILQELIRLGRRQSEEILALARRSVGGSQALPIDGYDDLTARQVTEQLPALTATQLRRLREYELRHANRKSVLTAVERLLD
jgi:hypothetical protein